MTRDLGPNGGTEPGTDRAEAVAAPTEDTTTSLFEPTNSARADAPSTPSLFEPVRSARGKGAVPDEVAASEPIGADQTPDETPTQPFTSTQPPTASPAGDITVNLAPAPDTESAASSSELFEESDATPTEPIGVGSADATPTEPIVVGSADATPTETLGVASAGDAATEPIVVGSADATPTEPIATGSAGSAADGAAVSSVGFVPANEVEEDLLSAADAGSTDTFLSTLLLARVLLPVAADSAPGSRPGDAGFVWRTEETDGETFVVVYTSPERLTDHTVTGVETVLVRFVQLIRRWPDESWSFAVNPGTPVGAKLPGEQIVGLANWAAEVGLGDDAGGEPEPPATEPAPASRARTAPPVTDPARPVVMQKAVAPSQLAYYLERGYDRVSGFVHRAGELAHLTSPAELYDALGLNHPDSPFDSAAEEVYVLRWPAYRPSLYRIPYGGQNESAMRAMEGWVIERPPFRGNGFAPGDSSEVVAEFKVDSARLPHGAQLWRLGADGSERLVATLDTDALTWRQAGAS